MMPMLNNWLLRQIIGTLNLACPFILLYKFAPDFAFTVPGICFYSLLVGVYLIYVNYNSAKKQLASLLYRPTQNYQEEFNSEIARCGINPQGISIRYAYTGDSIAMTIFNGVILDPFVWKNLEDPERVKASEIVEKYIIPTLPQDKKALLAMIQNEVTPDAQKFIFRHELAHAFYNYSHKRILLTGTIGIFVTCLALIFARQIIPVLGGLYTFISCLVLSCILDLILGFLIVNFFFKTKVEYNADIFATKFSTQTEIEAAADYFEKYEETAQIYRNHTNRLLKFIPTTILIGYIDGISRAKYLRKIAKNKQA